MPLQAYLEDIEAKTGKTPEEFIQLAHEKGFDTAAVDVEDIAVWLHEEYQLSHAHATALVQIIKHGTQISDRHSGSAGSYRDDSTAVKGQ